MAQKTVRLPIVCNAIAKGKYTFEGTKEGETVILDLTVTQADVNGDKAKVQCLTSQLSIADKYGVQVWCIFAKKYFTTLSLTSRIKFVAQMKNPCPGHSTQGKLKKIHLDSTLEGYANYMAPMRVSWIKEQVKSFKPEEAKRILTDDTLKPEDDKYLTPTWDELVPFPMTWKIRFEGVGKSNYEVDNHPYGRVKTTPTLPNSCPPWYQPQGPSTTGGTFTTVVCVCADAEAEGESEAEDKAAQLPSDEADKEKEKKHTHHCPCLGHSKKTPQHETAQPSTGCGAGR
ncbi:hypothetical protein JX266_009439 [Neoarthrinium moseri]|nr:hypothetical protein JX266_009439 [Neoarthrinium moseri]